MSTLKKYIPYIVLLYAVIVLINLYTDRDEVMWDFKVYYEASGDIEDPYDEEQFAEQSELDTGELTYKYPPVTLWFFKPFRSLGLDAALSVYFILLVLSTALLIWLWLKTLKTGKDPWFFVFLLLVFNASWFLAMRSGNISIFLTTAIWLGVYLYLKKEYWLFTAVICFAAFFKLTPVLLLGLFFFNEKPYKYLLGGAGIMSIYLLINYVADPELFMSFISSASGTVSETGIVNPNAYSLSMEVTSYLGDKAGIEDTYGLGLMGYIAFTILITAISVLLLKKHSDNNETTHPWYVVMVVLFAYMLILPRVKDYDYIIAIPLVYIVIRNVKVESFYLFLVIAVLSSVNVILPGVEYGMYLLWNYYPFFVLLGIWLLFVFEKDNKMYNTIKLI